MTVVSWAVSKVVWRGDQGRGFCPSARSDESPPGVLRPALEPPALEGCGPAGMSPEEAVKMIGELELSLTKTN